MAYPPPLRKGETDLLLQFPWRRPAPQPGTLRWGDFLGGQKVTKDPPKAGPSPAPETSTNPEATQKPETDVPQTGDAAQLSLVLGVLVLSAAGLAAVVNLRKRRS